MEVDERSLRFHRSSQAGVLSVVRILSAVFVSDETLLGDVIVIRAARRSRDAQGHIRHDLRLEDSLGAEQRHPSSRVTESRLENSSRDDVAVDGYLFLEPIKCR